MPRPMRGLPCAGGQGVKEPGAEAQSQASNTCPHSTCTLGSGFGPSVRVKCLGILVSFPWSGLEEGRKNLGAPNGGRRGDAEDEGG